jgi:hypothetical protein
MKFYWRMPSALTVHFKHELDAYKAEMVKQNLPAAWRHLERAHIIGQPWAVDHSLTHWKMLVFAFKIKNTKEIIGQLPRLFIGGIKSFVGKIPVGNTGGANVPPLQPMELPEDLKKIMQPYYAKQRKHP